MGVKSYGDDTFVILALLKAACQNNIFFVENQFWIKTQATNKCSTRAATPLKLYIQYHDGLLNRRVLDG